MNRFFLLGALCAALGSCALVKQAPDYTKLTAEERLQAATQIAQSTIMVDGHVDLPFRMKVGDLP